MRLSGTERSIALVRLAAVPFAVVQLAFSSGYPPGYRLLAWALTAALAVGGVVIWTFARRDLEGRAGHVLAIAALAFDTAIVSAFVTVYHFEDGTPTRQLLYLPVVEGAVRFALGGALVVALASLPAATLFERLRSGRIHTGFRLDFVTFQLGIEFLMALIVGSLVRRLRRETVDAEARADEAETLRDQLGRRADLLDGVNRCARAIGSTLDLDEAFRLFFRELRGIVSFDRVAVVLSEDGSARVVAAAGDASDTVMPPGWLHPTAGSVIERVMSDGQTIYRSDMTKPAYVEETALVALGVRSRVVAPLLLGPGTIGILSLSRHEPHAFDEREIELASLLGRLVATAVQNIRSYDAERRTVEELRRLSALRADFVSLVSHELRSPMAAVIGSARTLQSRWRELTPEQRESFLALIADETNRLAALIGDVLDTSRIDAGTFSISFAQVDVGALAADCVAAVALAQDEVPVVARVRGELPQVRGDGERLRQVLVNLIDNAVKYSPAGLPVEVDAQALDGRVVVAVSDRGPGIAPEDQRLVFEKFGRVSNGTSKPGTGLGLFIARSIAEAHGGKLELRSAPGRGATFSLVLPVA